MASERPAWGCVWGRNLRLVNYLYNSISYLEIWRREARWLQTLSKQDSAGQGYSQERPRKAGLRTSSPKKRAAPGGPCAGLLSTNGSPAPLCARVRWTKGRLSHRPSALLAGVRARAGLRMSGSMTPGDLGVNRRRLPPGAAQDREAAWPHPGPDDRPLRAIFRPIRSRRPPMLAQKHSAKLLADPLRRVSIAFARLHA